MPNSGDRPSFTNYTFLLRELRHLSAEIRGVRDRCGEIRVSSSRLARGSVRIQKAERSPSRCSLPRPARGSALGQEEEHTGAGIGRGLRASVRRTAPRAPVVHELKVDRLCVVHFNQESDTPAFRLWHKGAAARVRRVRKTLVTWHSGAKGVHPNHS